MPPLPGAGPGAYLIWNTVTGKVYVGGAYKSLRQRFEIHKRSLRSGRHENRHLQASWSKYGEASFRFIILEECAQEDVEVAEQKWLDHYQACDPSCGYNICPIAKSTAGMRHPPRSTLTRQKMSLSRAGKPKSAAHRANISKALSGKKKSRDHVEKVASQKRGRPISDGHRAKIASGVAKFCNDPSYRARLSAGVRKSLATKPVGWASARAKRAWRTRKANEEKKNGGTA